MPTVLNSVNDWLTLANSHDSHATLSLMATAREADRREGILFRQGKGWFQLPGSGHEAIAAAAFAMRKDDFLFPFYRDRALLMARGASVYDLALDFLAKRDSSSGGRQLANHYSDASNGAFSYASPTGIQCLPAVGASWFCQREGLGRIVLCCTGEAAVRQGEYYEALSLALQECLPVVFLVEDNGYGVSTPTKGMNPYTIGALAESHALCVDGRDVTAVFDSVQRAAERARSGHGPSVLWLAVDRLHSHSSSDDQRLYRPADELDAMRDRDPIVKLRDRLIAQGQLDADEWGRELAKIARFVDDAYERALAAPNPSPSDAHTHIFSAVPLPSSLSGLAPREDWTTADALNCTLRSLLEGDERVLLFGEDIEDPKGGIFGLTKGLSRDFQGRVVNSPLAEATIAGVACGLAVAGAKPIFELQFIDFAAIAFHQIVNQIATLRWRTAGKWKCPLVLLAPCGAYLPAGGPWHSQTNESWFAHAPGLQVAMPSTPQDTAALLRAAVAGDDPVLLLLPKHLFRKRWAWRDEGAIALGQARTCRAGSDVTVLAWGNCVELALEAAEMSGGKGISVEVVDLRSIVPCDWSAIRTSLEKTGRIVVVQEDNRTCSFGQAILAEIVSRRDLWDLLSGPPQLISRGDVHIGFNPILEAAVLPQSWQISEAIEAVVKY